ncbi:G-protein coupled receptor Mth2-like [Phymastichus coffea]|uniref:G-protein coupled receptor Mth2-like n=1 Tax=Phymastichus coffea TaxID=108790 RepID=UPI00273B506B|nr:G-protein coupled receptor Mth2-like [Phymastichus coffea]
MSRGTPSQCLLVAACLLAVSSSGWASECCEPGIDWRQESYMCEDDSRVKLNCQTGLYAIDPSAEEPDESYRVDRDSGWLVVADGSNKSSYNVTPAKFCRAQLAEQRRYLICFADEAEESAEPLWRVTFFGLASMASSAFLALTLLVYLVLPELRDLQDKAAMSVCASFMVAFFLNGDQSLDFPARLHDDAPCLLTAYSMYYAYMCAFFWLNVISLNIWRCVWLPSLRVESNTLFVVYCMVGWGVPLCFLALAVVAQNVDGFFVSPGFGQSTCWFDGHHATWLYFYGPILALLSMNLAYLGLTGWKLWHRYRRLDCCKIKVLRVKCAMCARLAVMMGVTWIFEVVSFAFEDTNPLYWILPDILNVMQGLFIFALFVVWRKKVRKLLAERRPFGVPFPKSWAACKDQERCHEDNEDELELSQTS